MPTEPAASNRLYGDLAAWFPLITAPAEYGEEARIYAGVILQAAPGARTLLELGSGGGNNASHLKRTFACTLADLSEEMLAVSRRLNPECEHVQGDMRDLRLGRTFDVIFVHDAVAYLTSPGDLGRAVVTAAEHLRPGGVALFVPDWTRENFAPRLDTGGNDGADGRSARYIEVTSDADPNGHVYTTDYVYVLREADGRTRVEHDHHDEGIFSRAEWHAVFAAAGFELLREAPGDSVEIGTMFLLRKR